MDDKGLMATKMTYPLANTFNSEVLPLEPSPLNIIPLRHFPQAKSTFCEDHLQQNNLPFDRLFSFTQQHPG